MRFYLGTHETSWLARVQIPLFVSRRRLQPRRTLPVATCRWSLDSGGFTELSQFGRWQITEAEYVRQVRRYQEEIGRLDWAAPMDWMCEPFVCEVTGKTVDEHQRLTVENFLRLRDELGTLVIPVLQGWAVDDYQRCVDLYERAGVDLAAERIVGVGSVCRRESTADAARIFRGLASQGLSLHGFGIKVAGLARYGDALASADSMAWSYAGRLRPLPDCTHKTCANCMRFALKWRREAVLTKLDQQRLWKDTTPCIA